MDAGRAVARRTLRNGLAGVGVLQRERQLQRLLCPLVDDLLPELALVPHAVQLALDVLLRDLQEPEHGVISLLAHQVEDAAVLLRGELPPSLLDAAREVLRAILPVEQLNVHVKLLLRTIIHPCAREYAHHLAELHCAARELRDVIFQSLEVLLVDLLVKLLVDGVDVLLLPLVVLSSLALELPDVVAALANVHVVRCALHCQAVDLVSELVDVALGLAAGALQTADAQVQGVQPLGGLLGDVRVVPLDAINSVIDLLVQIIVLLPEVCLGFAEPGVQNSVVGVYLVVNVLVDLGVFDGDGLKLPAVLGPLLQTAGDRRIVVLHLPNGVVVVGVNLVIELLNFASDLVQRLVHLPPTTVHLQAQRRGHVTHSLDGGIDIVVHVIPCDNVRLGVELGLCLITKLCNVLGELVAALVCLLQALRDVLHPSVVRLERLLHVAHVQAHGRDFGRYCGLHTLPRGDDRVRGIYSRAHLVEVHVDGIHGCCEVLHVTLASENNSLHMGDIALLTAQHVLELTDVVLDRIEVVHEALHAWSVATPTTATSGLGSEERDPFLDVCRHDLQLAGDLRLEVCHPVRDLLQQLGIASLAPQPWLACGRVLGLPATSRKFGEHPRFELLEPVIEVGLGGLGALLELRLQLPRLGVDYI
mmetsp:Transcript_137284/g.382944  ORF Transcript_137284/g.382944 Transcript_137284/m.382944 type:complete len:646 (+) Transcript_137284:493-2430(+)